MPLRATPRFLTRTARMRHVVGVLALLAATFGAAWIRFGQIEAYVGFESINPSVTY